MEKNKNTNAAAGYEAFTDAELLRAMELLIRPEWLRERQVIIEVLRVLDFSPEDVKAQLDDGTPLNDGEPIRL